MSFWNDLSYYEWSKDQLEKHGFSVTPEEASHALGNVHIHRGERFIIMLDTVEGLYGFAHGVLEGVKNDKN